VNTQRAKLRKNANYKPALAFSVRIPAIKNAQSSETHASAPVRRLLRKGLLRQHGGQLWSIM